MATKTFAPPVATFKSGSEGEKWLRLTPPVDGFSWVRARCVHHTPHRLWPCLQGALYAQRAVDFTNLAMATLRTILGEDKVVVSHASLYCCIPNNRAVAASNRAVTASNRAVAGA